MAHVGEEELSECEVLWPEARGCGCGDGALASALLVGSSSPRFFSRNQRPCSTGSLPVDIPMASARLPRGRDDSWWNDDEDEEEEAAGGCGAMVPPHVMVSRRRSEAAVAFSLRSGPGTARRDLNQLRNSVLRMTGFIEG